MSTTKRNQIIPAAMLVQGLEATQQLTTVTPRDQALFRRREAIAHELGWETIRVSLGTGRDMAQTAAHLSEIWHVRVEEGTLRRLVRAEAYRRCAAAGEALQGAKRNEKEAAKAKLQIAESILLRS